MIAAVKSIILAAALVLSCAAGALGGISTRTVATWQVNGEGDIVVSVDVYNDGGETAYALETAMFLGRRVYFRGVRGDNPPGGKRHLDFLVEGTSIAPGTYTAVIRVSFEEQSGRRHRVYHPVPITYLRREAPGTPSPIRAAVVDPVFNPRVFWKKDGEIAVTLTNRGQARLPFHLAIWYPDGFSIRPDVAEVDLAPGEEKTVRLSAALTDARRTDEYYLVVDAETPYRHHSVLIRGVLSVFPRPVYFKIYLILAAAGAFFFAVRTVLSLLRK